MFCPLCGSELEELETPEAREVDWTLEGEALAAAIKWAEEAEPIEREEYECPEGCFGKDFPLYCHHPFGGINSAPGDSWSLSWVK